MAIYAQAEGRARNNPCSFVFIRGSQSRAQAEGRVRNNPCSFVFIRGSQSRAQAEGRARNNPCSFVFIRGSQSHAQAEGRAHISSHYVSGFVLAPGHDRTGFIQRSVAKMVGIHGGIEP
jgi:hypothetical protein